MWKMDRLGRLLVNVQEKLEFAWPGGHICNKISLCVITVLLNITIRVDRLHVEDELLLVLLFMLAKILLKLLPLAMK